MAHKAWVITMRSLHGASDIDSHHVENISARKKIAFVDDYLCDLYEELLDQQGIDQEFDEEAVRKAITHPSGTEVVLEHGPFLLRAVLQEVVEG